MPDNLTPEQRRYTMSRVPSKDTGPGRRLRSALHRAGYRFRLHRKDLPGTPDIVLPRHKVAIFVHGCFWHQHEGCRRSVRPTSNADYWTAKLDRNVMRDRKNIEDLTALGWKALIVWERQARFTDQVITALQQLDQR